MPILKLQGNAERKKGIYYEVDSDNTLIGVGGMGKVYQGRQVDEQTGATRAVAIKFLFSDLTPEAIEKARREASIQLQNDNLIEMLGFIETQEGVVLGQPVKHFHVVSELIHGVSLSDLMKGKTADFEGHEVQFAAEMLRDYRNNPLEFAKNIVHTILLGLMALHNAGYIHRDIDPSNIMLTSDRKVKLIDFGIAKKVKALSGDDVSKTKSGVFIGKAEYAAPELVLGDINHQNQTTDIYAMGILLFQCITGFPPFQGDSKTTIADVLVMQQKKDVPLTAIKNKYLRAVIRKATQKKQERRYQSTAEMMVAMEQMPTPLKKESFPFFWQKPAAVAAITAILGVAVAFGISSMNSSKNGINAPVAETQAAKPASDDPLENIKMKLENKETALEGFKELEAMSDNGNGEATFLLSRLYFNPDNSADIISSELVGMRENVQFRDNLKAHELLTKAIKVQSCKNFYAYYEYGMDLLEGERRCPEYKSLQDSKDGQFLQEAKRHLEKALDGAKESKDSEDLYVKGLANTVRGKSITGLEYVVRLMSLPQYKLMTRGEADSYIENIKK